MSHINKISLSCTFNKVEANSNGMRSMELDSTANKEVLTQIEPNVDEKGVDPAETDEAQLEGILTLFAENSPWKKNF